MTRGRPGRPGEERARENGDEAEALGSTDGKGKAVANGANGTPDVPSPTTAEARDHADSFEAAAAHNGNGTHTRADGSAAAQGPESSGSDSEFKIEDVGDIAQSWGD